MMTASAWAPRRLGDVATMRSGGTPSRSVPRYFGGGIPWVSITDMTRSGKYLTSTATTLSADGLAASAATMYDDDVVLYAMYASLGEVSLPVGSMSSSQAILGIKPGRELDRAYLYYFLESIKDDVKKLGQQGTQSNLNSGMVRDIRIPVPELSEQRRIASSLSNVDDMIATLERLVAKKQAIKQGMMQELLTGRTRLPGFIDDWRLLQVADLARVTGGGTPSTGIPSYWSGNIPWFTPAEIGRAGSGLVSRSERTITEDGLAHSAAALLPAGTVLVTSRASIGHCAVAEVPVTTNQGFTSMVPKDIRSTWFLYYWTQQNRGALESRSAGSTFLEISASKVAAIPINCPSLDEQSVIGSALRDTDGEIDKLNARLAKARAIKQGMMQQLLTGKIRLSVEVAS